MSHWEPEREARLVVMFNAGATRRELAREFGLTPGGIDAKLSRLMGRARSRLPSDADAAFGDALDGRRFEDVKFKAVAA